MSSRWYVSVRKYLSARLRSNWTISDSSNVGCIKRVKRYWFDWFNDDAVPLFCIAEAIFVLIFEPNPIILFEFEPTPLDDAAAVAASNNGFDAIVTSRFALLDDDGCCIEPIPFELEDLNKNT